MTRKKATVILEGNEVAVQRAIHELQKFVSEANRQPELDATSQVDELTERMDYEPEFHRATED